MSSFRNCPHHEGDQNSKSKELPIKIPAKHLNIVWGNDSRYWNLPKTTDEAAELIQVCWLEVTASADTDPMKMYEVGFEVSLTPDAFGWGGCHVVVMAKRGKNGKYSGKKVALPDYTDGGRFDISVELKECSTTTTDGKLYFGLYEVWSGRWKGGLKIHNAFVRELPN